MMRSMNIALMTLALAGWVTTASAQTLVWSDNFDSPLAGWTPTTLAQITWLSGQYFGISGNFGPLQPNTPTATHAAGYHSIPALGPLPDNQTLELRADLFGVSANDAWADLHFLWLPQGQGYAVFKDQDEIALCKFYNGATAVAWLFYLERSLPDENVTLVLALTRRGSNVEITTRVLDKGNTNAVLFERTVTDTPQADPVLPNLPIPALQGTRSAPDISGTPWPVLVAPGNVELSVTWVGSQSPPNGSAGAVFDNLRVLQYESPLLSIQNAVVLSWPLTQGRFVLESATDVAGPWAPVTNPWCRTNAAQNEVSILAPDSMRLFRLRQD